MRDMVKASFAVLSIALYSSCAANTTYRGLPVSSLTDDQLLAELQSAATGFGIQFDRTMYLMAVRPEPAYGAGCLDS